MLFSDEIDNVLKLHLPKRYLGTYAVDELPNISEDKSTACFIFNTDPSTGPGEHWLAFSLSGRRANELILFDPLAMSPITYLPRLEKYLKRNFPFHTVTKSGFPIQGIRSKSCGKFCAYVLLYLKSYGFNLRRLLEERFVEDDLVFNENVITKWWGGV